MILNLSFNKTSVSREFAPLNRWVTQKPVCYLAVTALT